MSTDYISVLNSNFSFNSLPYLTPPCSRGSPVGVNCLIISSLLACSQCDASNSCSFNACHILIEMKSDNRRLNSKTLVGNHCGNLFPGNLFSKS